VARSCWYTFRDRVAPLLQDLNARVLQDAVAQGVTPATRAAGDGTLVAANASRHKLLHQEQCQRRLERLSAAVAADQHRPSTIAVAAATAAPSAARLALPLLATAPAEPVERAATDAAAEPPEWLAGTAGGRLQQQQRLQRAQQRLHELHASNQRKWPSKRKAKDQIVVSVLDPEAVVGRDKEKVFRPLYNVQIFDDLDSPLILGYGLFAQQNDSGLLGPMLQRTEQQVGHRLNLVLVDASYAGGADLAEAERAGVRVYAPVPGDGVKEPKQIPKREFVWQASEPSAPAPDGRVAATSGVRRPGAALNLSWLLPSQRRFRHLNAHLIVDISPLRVIIVVESYSGLAAPVRPTQGGWVALALNPFPGMTPRLPSVLGGPNLSPDGSCRTVGRAPPRSSVPPSPRQRRRNVDTTAIPWPLAVLVVDDNRDAADALAWLLKLWGYRPVVAYDGYAALQLAAAEPFAAALIDLGLPCLDGYELVRRLRVVPYLEEAVLIAVTGSGQEQDRRRCRQAGFHHHLLKPCDPQELRRLLPVVGAWAGATPSGSPIEIA
jgi:CheY-like chemotaxis protein